MAFICIHLPRQVSKEVTGPLTASFHKAEANAKSITSANNVATKKLKLVSAQASKKVGSRRDTPIIFLRTRLTQVSPFSTNNSTRPAMTHTASCKLPTKPTKQSPTKVAKRVPRKGLLSINCGKSLVGGGHCPKHEHR